MALQGGADTQRTSPPYFQGKPDHETTAGESDYRTKLGMG